MTDTTDTLPIDGNPARRRIEIWHVALVAPVLLFIAAFFFVPLMYMIRMSLTNSAGAFDAAAYRNLLTDSFFYLMTLNSLLLGVCTTAATLVLGYIVAHYLVGSSGWERTLISAACLMPVFVNIIVGVLGWYILFLPFGVLQKLFHSLGLLDGPLWALKSFWALVAVLVYEHLPFAVLILAASIQNVPAEKINAARTLGASTARIFFTVMLPLTAPGVVATSVLVFSLAISSYLVPILITGQRIMVLPIAIFSHTSELLDWQLASAMALVLLIIVGTIAYLFTVITNRANRRGQWEMV